MNKSLYKRCKTGHVPGQVNKLVLARMLEHPNESARAKAYKKEFVKKANRKFRKTWYE